MLYLESLLEYAGSMKVEFVVLFFVLFAIHQSLTFKRAKVPGPYPWPVIGNAISLGDQPHVAMQKMAKKYGPVFLMKLGGADVLVLNDYASIKEALGRQKLVFEGRPQFDSFAEVSQGKGIVFNSPQTQGKNWRRLKMAVIKHLHKFVSSSNTRKLLSDHIRKETIEMVNRMNQQAKDSPDGYIEPQAIINVSIANIVCSLMFGHRYNHENKEFQDLVSMNEKFGEVVGSGSQVDVMPWIKIFPSFRKALKTFDFLTRRMNNWMAKRTKEHRSNYAHGVTRDVVDTFISDGIENKNSLFKDDIIMAMTTDIFGAAQDTLSTAVQWIIIYMMYFPDVQRKVQEELGSILGEASLPDIEDGKRFPYTMAVLHEIFRHSTFTATTIPHLTTENTNLGGYRIPKGILVFVNQYAVNYDPRHWEEPKEFKPERFLTADGNLIDKPHERYILFSYGSRKCPGDELSRVLLLNLMASVCTLCEFESDPKKPTTLEGVYNLSSRPKHLRTKVRIRNPNIFSEMVANLSHLSPHVPTVDSCNSSFTSASTSAESKKVHKRSSDPSTCESSLFIKQQPRFQDLCSNGQFFYREPSASLPSRE